MAAAYWLAAEPKSDNLIELPDRLSRSQISRNSPFRPCVKMRAIRQGCRKGARPDGLAPAPAERSGTFRGQA